MLENAGLFLGGLLLLIFGADWLVRGASKLAFKLGISPLVVGLTVVAFGTSAPELAINIQSSLGGQPDLALGNVVGSNIFNVLFILGLSALITPLLVDRQLIRLDVPLMLVASLAVYLLALDGNLSTLEGGLLFGSMLFYLIFIIRQSRHENQANDSQESSQSSPIPSKLDLLPFQLLLILAGLAALVLGSGWLVGGAVAFARHFGVSELIIGLTIVAAGTSMPEVATSIMAALKGERDIAVGNVVGSNIFNLLSVLGLTSLLVPGGIPISTAALGFDLPVMVVVAFATLPIFFTGQIIDRWEGGIFLFYYIAYTLYLIMDATSHDLLPLFGTTMLYFIAPLTLITLYLLFYREKRRSKGR
ncbi:calcium/sodium antiporter [Wolinella succinogenes]|uniref:Sodium/calcium exchanger membrane region domain-containing protein n=1 Tax=Wolinella succinogenes (strain ATCC 29543 / DSM 1740 / CCUG 13145 / JCM 31913 / LMG 7466 / NCTC 11488 / FDC 602W) TaxID=273121 RepID=Q7MQM9_WOLSU|nr:calcium/sodium antiporter [Wolinella succinogenes]CAE11164.1 conserved hypothetical protein [Wolinella succinogenes]VEG81330.1 Inner membrane protein yrbG [Wolinella succinogenes]HCZ19854.1 sodium:calcium antiporter [Helicobacter sp.]